MRWSDSRQSPLARRILIVVAVLPVALSCGGDGGTVRPTTCILFTAAQAPAPATVAARAAAGSSCDTALVELVATDVDDVFAADFEVLFDPAVARWAGVSIAGSHLGSDGARVEVLESAQGGRVSLGISRVGTSTGIDFAGSRVLATLRFDKVADGSGAVSLQDAELLGSETPPAPKPGIVWSGGTLAVR